MATSGVLAGVAASALAPGGDPSLDEIENVLIVAVTEKRTRVELDTYAELLRKVVA